MGNNKSQTFLTVIMLFTLVYLISLPIASSDTQTLFEGDIDFEGNVIKVMACDRTDILLGFASADSSTNKVTFAVWKNGQIIGTEEIDVEVIRTGYTENVKTGEDSTINIFGTKKFFILENWGLNCIFKIDYLEYATNEKEKTMLRIEDQIVNFDASQTAWESFEKLAIPDSKLPPYHLGGDYPMKTTKKETWIERDVDNDLYPVLTQVIEGNSFPDLPEYQGGASRWEWLVVLEPSSNFFNELYSVFENKKTVKIKDFEIEIYKGGDAVFSRIGPYTFLLMVTKATTIEKKDSPLSELTEQIFIKGIKNAMNYDLSVFPPETLPPQTTIPPTSPPQITSTPTPETIPATTTPSQNDNNLLLIVAATVLGIATVGAYFWVKKPSTTQSQEVITPTSLKPSYSTAIEVSDLVKKYRNSVILKNVSFTVPPGILCAIVGLSGGGKSTIIEAIAGRIPPDSGKVTIVGKDADKNRMELNKIVGFVPQHPELNMNQTVWENMMNSTIKWEVKEAGLKSTLILKQLGILGRKEVIAKNLSGGQLKRLSLAMELIREPEILILDEPTTGLDPTSRDHILTALTKIVTTNKKTVLFTTHFMDEAEHCDEVIIIGDAKVLAKGSPSQLVRKLPGTGKVVSITLEQVSEELVKKLEKLPDVKKVIREGRVLKIISDKPDPVELSQKVKELGGIVEKSEVKKAGMKEVFVYFTGKMPEE